MLSPKCPQCAKPLSLVGSVGIVDYESRWDAQATRYRCEGGHMIFICDAERIEESESESEEV